MRIYKQYPLFGAKICTDICPRTLSVRFEEQIMSKDKYPSIFSCQMETIVFIILQIFFATRTVLKVREYPRILDKNYRVFNNFLKSREWLSYTGSTAYTNNTLCSLNIMVSSAAHQNGPLCSQLCLTSVIILVMIPPKFFLSLLHRE